MSGHRRQLTPPITKTSKKKIRKREIAEKSQPPPSKPPKKKSKKNKKSATIPESDTVTGSGAQQELQDTTVGVVPEFINGESRALENIGEMKKTTKKVKPEERTSFRRVADEDWLGKKGSRDNSYSATFGEGGWGAKAQKVFSSVRGKNFRHQKTKKKRGTYFGGKISVDAVNSIKFDSDDD